MIDSSDNRLIFSSNETSSSTERSNDLGNNTRHQHNSNPCYPFSEVTMSDEVVEWYNAVQLQQENHLTQRLAAIKANEESKVMQLTPYYIYFPESFDEVSRNLKKNARVSYDALDNTNSFDSTPLSTARTYGEISHTPLNSTYSAFVLEGGSPSSGGAKPASNILTSSSAVIPMDTEQYSGYTRSCSTSYTVEELIREWTWRPVNEIIEEQLRAIPALYKGDVVCDEATDKMLNDIILKQKLNKTILDDQFRRELHQYQNGSLQVIPSMLDTCDILDDSQEECRSTVVRLRNAKERAVNSVRLLGAYRKRNNRKAFLVDLESVVSWQEKFSSVVNQIEQKEYARAAQTLEAKLNRVDGYFFKRMENSGASDHINGVSSTKQCCSQVAESLSFIDQHRQPDGVGAEDTTVAYRDCRNTDSGRSQAEVALVKGDWDERREVKSTFLFDEFFLGVSTDVMSKLHCGKIVIAQFFELRQCGALLIGTCIRQDVSLLLTERFNCSMLFKALKGLHALHIRQKDISDFFLEIVEPILFEIIRSSLADVVGDDVGESWEDIAKNLTPSELHPCTIAMLTKLSAALRNILKVGRACNRLQEEGDALLCYVEKKLNKSKKNSSNSLKPNKPANRSRSSSKSNYQMDFFGETTSTEEAKTILEGCKFLSMIGTKSIHLCLSAVSNFAQNANLQRGNVQDALHVYRLLDLFVEMCASGAPNDHCAQSTKIALRLQWESLFAKHFHSKALDEILKILQNDQFVPFPVDAGDFPGITPFLEKEEDATEGIFREYLVFDSQDTGTLCRKLYENEYQNDHKKQQEISTPNPAKPVVTSRALTYSLLVTKIEEEFNLDVAPNPFSSNQYFLQPTYFALEPSPGRKPETLFDICPFPLFTFSSYMVCKKMFEQVEQSKSQAAAAEDFCELMHHLTCCYLNFIWTHFVAGDEVVPQDTDRTIPPYIQGYVAIIQRYSQRAASSCDTMLNAGFPYCQNQPCHQWKAHMNNPDQMFGARERCSALVSLESVAACHRLCVKALAGILSPTSLTSIVELREAVDGFTKYALQRGLLLLAINIIPFDSTARVIYETSTYDDISNNSSIFFPAFGSTTAKKSTTAISKDVTASDSSPWVSQSIALITKVKSKLHNMYNGGPSIASRKLLDQCIVHIFVSTVEGITRRKKYTEVGKAAMMHDCNALTKCLKDLHPTLSRPWTEHVMRIARCIAFSSWLEVLQLVKSHHRSYKYHQLMSFGEREGMLKRRELEALMKDLASTGPPLEDHTIVLQLLDAATAAAVIK